MSQRQWQMALTLGPLIAIVPLSIDFYLPAFPSIGNALVADDGAVQLSLVAFMLAMTAGPLVIGPISDRIGRRVPLMAGFAVYTLASIACAWAPTIGALVAFRFLQGLGGAVSQVCCRACVRDQYSGFEAARLMSMMMLVIGVAPILAPIAGSLVIAHLPWTALFYILAAFGGCAILIILFALPETLPAGRRASGGIVAVLLGYWQLVRARSFIVVALTGAISHAGFFAYLVSSSFVLIGHYGMTPAQFSLIFGSNACALILGTQVNVWLLPRLGIVRIVAGATTLYSVATLGLLVALLVAVPVQVFIAALFIVVACLGFINANTTAMALDQQGDRAGTAAGLLGVLQTGLGATAGLVVSIIGDGSPMALGSVMSVCAVSGFLLFRLRGTAASLR